jgi:RimJ/RimL family protein N-acetyltransferase
MTLHDATFIVDLFTQPSFVENIGDRGVHSVEGAARYIRNGPLASYAARGFGFYVVEERSGAGSGAPGERTAGICGLIQRDGLETVDIGFAFLPQFWGRGYATEAASAVLAMAPGHGLDVVLAVAKPENLASLRVLEKIGMARTGSVRLPGETIDLALYSNRPGATPA